MIPLAAIYWMILDVKNSLDGVDTQGAMSGPHERDAYRSGIDLKAFRMTERHHALFGASISLLSCLMDAQEARHNWPVVVRAQ